MAIKIKGQRRTVWIICSLFLSVTVYGQDSLRNTPLTLPEAYRLALNNSTQLKITRTNTELSKTQTAIGKLDQLPSLSTSFSYGYLGNADVWDSHLSHHQTVSFPHQFASFAVEASETIFAGGQINNSIRRSTLEDQIAFLRQEKAETDIKFLVTAGYLDIYRLLNQRNVYINNTRLARQRLQNILSLRN